MSAGAPAPHPLAFAALLTGAVAIGFAPIFVRLADVSPAASAFWRVALATPILWAWTLARARQAQADPHVTGRAAPAWLAGFFFACDLGAWHLAINWTSVANATLEANMAPLFVTLGAWLLWRQRPRLLFLAALALTLCGAVLLIGPNLQRAGASGQAFTGDLLGLLTAVFYAGYMLALKRAAGRLSTARVMLYSTTACALVLLPWALLTAEHLLPASPKGWLVLAGLALVAQVGGQSLIAFAFAHLPAALSAASLILQPVMSMLFAWALLGEAMGPLQMLGATIVLAGIYMARRSA